MRLVQLRWIFSGAYFISLLACFEGLGGQSTSLTLVGVVPARAYFNETRGLAPFQSTLDAKSAEVFHMTEVKNQLDPEMITISSINHSNINTENGKKINYTVTYNGIPLDLKSGTQRFVDREPTQARKHVLVREHVLSISLRPQQNRRSALNSYSDTITFTISTL